MKDNPFKISHTTVNDSRVRGYQTQRNEGDNFLFLPDFTSWLGMTFEDKRVGIFFLMILLIMSTLLGRSIYLQALQGSHFRGIADGNRIKKIYLKAPRGILFDRFDRPLVTNEASFSLYLNPRLIQNDAQASSLHDFLDKQLPEENEKILNFFNTYKHNDQLTLVATDIPYDKAMLLDISSSNFAAMQVASEPMRHYLYDYGLAHLFGYVSKITQDELDQRPSYGLTDMTGKSGLEKQYDDSLRGTDGIVSIEVDALGREKGEISKSPPLTGYGITLTLDVSLQDKLYSTLLEASKNNNNLPAAGVAMDPDTGEILAIASVPSYDPNLFSHTLEEEQYEELVSNPNAPLFDRSIAGAYPAGSVFKMTVAAAALETHSITENFTVNSSGGVYLGNRFFPDWKAGGHGTTNLNKALSDSVNTYFYTIGGGTDTHQGIGPQKIIEYAKLLGFGEMTGFDIPGEVAGELPDPNGSDENGSRWYQGDTYNLSIGQGALLVTPLQIAQYTAFFANGGKLMTPHVVKTIHSSQGDTNISPVVKNKTAILAESTIDSIRSGMRRTVVSGTAKSLQSVPVPVAGKTGTAQFNKNKQPHSWFTAFAPYDKPSFVLSVIVEQGGEKGLAVGVSRQVFEWYFNQKKS